MKIAEAATAHRSAAGQLDASSGARQPCLAPARNAVSFLRVVGTRVAEARGLARRSRREGRLLPEFPEFPVPDRLFLARVARDTLESRGWSAELGLSADGAIAGAAVSYAGSPRRLSGFGASAI